MFPMVSVVIPVFNVQEYISQCLNSIISQTYKDIEIIVVDDGSTDNSLSICMEYKQKNNNIIVIHQDNKGLSKARNRGIAEAKGDYITFVDSDDYVSDIFVEMLVETITKTNTRIATTKSYVSFIDDKDVIFDKKDSAVDRVTIFEKNDFIKMMMLEKICTGAPFKIYDRSIFEKYQFPDGYYEDLAIMYRLCSDQEAISVLDMKLYAYRIRDNSIIRNKNIENKKAIIPITDEMVGCFEGCSKDVLNAVKARSLMTIFSVFLQAPRSQTLLRRELWKRIVKYRNPVFLILGNKKLVFEYMLSYLGMDISYAIGSFIKKIVR